MSTCTCDMDGRGKASHCRRCCLTFSGPSAFDQHIVNGAHQPPQSRGLTQVRPGVWGSPATDASRLLRSALTAERDRVKVTG